MHASTKLTLATAFLLATTPAYAVDMVVFVSETSPIQHISADELTDIYLGKTSHIGSEKLFPIFFIEGNDARADFLHTALSVSDYAYKIHWMKHIFRGGGVPPREVTSETEAIAAVKSNPGGVGFMYASQAHATPGIREILRMSLD